MISLEDFVSETLVQLINGVKKAQAEAEKLGAEVCPLYEKSPTAKTELSGNKLVQNVHFDVAITAEAGKETKGGIGVFLGGVGAGAQGQSNMASSTVNRISFDVMVSLPKQDCKWGTE